METDQTPDALTARNVLDLRKRRGLTVRDLSEALGALGYPMLPSAITKIERQERRVNVNDLVALALALNTTPNRLLLSVDGSDVALTPKVHASQSEAWKWADGINALDDAVELTHSGEKPVLDVHGDFRRNSRPPEEHERNQHTAARAARDVLDRIHILLGAGSNAPLEDVLRQPVDYGSSGSNAVTLRRALSRLSAEVDDLIGDEGGRDGDR